MTDIRVYTDEEVERLTDRSAVREALVRYSEGRTSANAVAYLEALCQAEIIDMLYKGCRKLPGLLNK